MSGPHISIAQSGFYIPIETEQNDLENLQTHSGILYKFHNGIKPYRRIAVAQQLGEFTDSAQSELNPYIHAARKHFPDCNFSGESAEAQVADSIKPVLNHFYKDGKHFYSYSNDHFSFAVDPVLQLGFGKESKNTDYLYLNQRGLQLQAGIDQKFNARLFILETQQSALSFVNEYEQLYDAFPGAGLYKNYEGKLIKLNRGYDYLLAEGELSYDASRHVSISVGHGKNFVGFGQRSLLLSDFSAPYFFLKLQTNVWKLHYQNIYAELSSETLADKGNRLLPKKYMASHVLSLNITKRWNLGLFESVVFGRQNQFEFQYLNPVILFRFVEQSLGSPDNAFLGLQSQYLQNKSMMLYGQLIFDEFLLKEFVQFSGWWGNKYGAQLGLKYFDAFRIKDLGIQAEWNVVRPYTYTFRDSIANYSHYHQSLAHPLGANFSEWLCKISYRISDRAFLKFSANYYQKGLDRDSFNFGGNILKDYDTRIGDSDNFLLQGEKHRVLNFKLESAYKLWPQTYLDLGIYLRNENSGLNKRTFVWFQLGFRMTIAKQSFDL
ncbi:MAG: hypothetical protein IPM34_02315 [Saprospiraceae bacterium]|nr:hypothetical protein [Saprospiraceae bacterium]